MSLRVDDMFVRLRREEVSLALLSHASHLEPMNRVNSMIGRGSIIAAYQLFETSRCLSRSDKI